MIVIDDGAMNKVMLALRLLSRQGFVRAAYLFGSQVEGTADEWSDIDVAVFMDGVESWDLPRHVHTMSRVMEATNDDVEVHLFPASSLENPGRGSFVENILNYGIRVSAETC